MDTTVVSEKEKEYGRGRHSGSGWAIGFGVSIILLLFIAVLAFQGRRADAVQRDALESITTSSSAAAQDAKQAAATARSLESRVGTLDISVADATAKVEKLAETVDGTAKAFSSEIQEIRKDVAEKTGELSSMVAEALAEARNSIEQRVGQAEERILSEAAKEREAAPPAPVPAPQVQPMSDRFPISPPLPEGVRFLSSRYEREIVPYGERSEWIPWRKARGAWSVIVSPGIPGIEALVQRYWLEPPELIPVPTSGIISIPGEYRKISFRMTTANPDARFAVWKIKH